MSRSSGIGRLVLFIILGLILGGILGEVLGVVLGQIGVISGGGVDNPIRSFFVEDWVLDLGLDKGGILIDLYMFKFLIGVGFKFNFASIIGLFLSLYIMKWSK